MDKQLIRICDSTFLQYSKSASVGGENIGLGPKNFEWQLSDITSARVVTDGHIKDAPGKGQIAWLIEPESLHPENYEVARQRAHEFDIVLTHNFGFITNNVFYYSLGGSWINVEHWGNHEKYKCVSIILSDKNTLKGHKFRHRIVELFEDKIDAIFGKGINPVESKFTALAPYQFSIVVESCQDPGYFSEKLIDCISVGTIPIYWGSDIGNSLFESVIQVFDMQDVNRVLDMIWEGTISNHFGVPKDDIEKAKSFVVCEDQFAHLL